MAHWMESAGGVVWMLIGANVAVFMLWRVADLGFMRRHFMISLDNFKSGRLHTLLTSAFSHAETDHLFTNMIGLYFFGTSIASMFGPAFLLKLYVAGALTGSAFFLLEKAFLAPWKRPDGAGLQRDPERRAAAHFDQADLPLEVLADHGALDEGAGPELREPGERGGDDDHGGEDRAAHEEEPLPPTPSPSGSEEERDDAVTARVDSTTGELKRLPGLRPPLAATARQSSSPACGAPRCRLSRPPSPATPSSPASIASMRSCSRSRTAPW